MPHAQPHAPQTMSRKQATFSNHWLLDEKDQYKRTQRLELYLRCFDQPMLEVGQGYQNMYQALKDKNYDLASP